MTPHQLWIPPAFLEERCEDRLHVLLWQARGEAQVRVWGGRPQTELSEGHALWVPVGTRHSVSVRANSVIVPLGFEASEFATTLREPALITVDRDLHSMMLAHHVSWSSALTPAADTTRQLLSLIERSPIVSASLPMPVTEQASHIAETLRFNPGDTRSVSELAESVFVSARSLERAFLRETGMTLRRWRILCRMDAAQALLRSEVSLQAVARRVGYSNVNAFRRTFTEHVGVTPTEFQKGSGSPLWEGRTAPDQMNSAGSSA